MFSTTKSTLWLGEIPQLGQRGFQSCGKETQSVPLRRSDKVLEFLRKFLGGEFSLFEMD